MTNEEIKTKKSVLIIDDAIYGTLKLIAFLGIPFLASLWFIFGSIFDVKSTQVILGILAIISSFLGLYLVLATIKYNTSADRFDGNINITEGTNGKRIYELELNGHPTMLDDMQSASFRIISPK